MYCSSVLSPAESCRQREQSFLQEDREAFLDWIISLSSSLSDCLSHHCRKHCHVHQQRERQTKHEAALTHAMESSEAARMGNFCVASKVAGEECPCLSGASSCFSQMQLNGRVPSVKNVLTWMFTLAKERLFRSLLRAGLLPKVLLKLGGYIHCYVTTAKICNTSSPHPFQLCSVKGFAFLYSALAFSPFWLLEMGVSISFCPSFPPIIRL